MFIKKYHCSLSEDFSGQKFLPIPFFFFTRMILPVIKGAQPLSFAFCPLGAGLSPLSGSTSHLQQELLYPQVLSQAALSGNSGVQLTKEKRKQKNPCSFSSWTN